MEVGRLLHHVRLRVQGSFRLLTVVCVSGSRKQSNLCFSHHVFPAGNPEALTPTAPCKSATQSGKHSPSDHGDHVGVVHLGGVHVHLGSDHLGGVHLGSDHLDGVHLPPSDPSSKACPCYQAKTTNPSTDDQSDNHGSHVTIAFLPTQPKFIYVIP